MNQTLNKGNCFIFSVLFKLKHPDSKIFIRWNRESQVVSFSVVHKNKTYFYRRKDRSQSKFWFNGKIVTQTLKPAGGIRSASSTNMSTENTASNAPKQLIIVEKVNRLQGLNDELHITVITDLKGITDRIRRIGLSMNGVNHPDNRPTMPAAMNGDSNGGTQQPKPNVDGLEGSLQSCIESEGAFLFAWHNSILPQLNSYLGYIEEHI